MLRNHFARLCLCVLLSALGLTFPARGASSSGPVYQAQKKVNEAESQLHKAKIALNREAGKIRQQIEATADYKKAAAAERAARQKYTEAATAAKRTLAQSPAYQEAVRQRDLRQAERDELRAKPDAAPDQRAQAAIALLKAQQAVSHIEQETIAADPKVAQAKDEVDQASAKLAEIQNTFPQYAQKDSTYQSAKQQVEQAVHAVEDAAKQLKAAKQQQEAADQQQFDQDLRNAQNAVMRRPGYR